MTQKAEIRHRFIPLVENVERTGDRLSIIRTDYEPLSFTPKTSRFADALLQLQGDGASWARLIATAAQDGDDRAEAGINHYLERFCYGRLLEWTISIDGTLLATVETQNRGFGPDEVSDPPDTCELSRFSWMRRHGDKLVLESGLAPGHAILTRDGAALIGALSDPALNDPDARSFAEALWRFGFCEDSEVEETPARKTWQFHDKLMHEMSRFNRQGMQAGGNYRFTEALPPPPAIKPDPEGEIIALPEVDDTEISNSSDPLFAIMERRYSGREFDDSELTLEALSTFLYRVARIDEVIEDPVQDLLHRPFPSGGSIYEIEFYIAVRNCKGLEPGVYLYQGHHHRLIALPDSHSAAERMLLVSGLAMAQPDDPPDTVIVLASRVPRMAWKYEAMAYRASMLNAGVILQTMYLVATDMGLQGCANGIGDSSIFAEVTGLDPFEETSIAEFALSGPAARS